MKKNRELEMSIYEHLDELRRRLIWVMVTLVIAVAVSFTFADTALAIITRPVGNLVMLRPSEGLLVRIRLALWMGLVLNSPVILYHALAYVLPALTRREKIGLFIFLPAGLLFFAAGATFSFLVIVPYIYSFLLGFSSESLQPFISVDNYVSFVTNLVIPFGVIFELPVVVLLLTSLGVITPSFLARNRKYAVLIIFVAAALLSPPDVISQVIMGLPLLGLYEFSILLSRLIYRRRQKVESEETETDHSAEP